MQHTGNAWFEVTCTSPRGARSVKFKYHFTTGNDMNKLSAASKALAIENKYKAQGWSVRTVQTGVLDEAKKKSQLRKSK